MPYVGRTPTPSPVTADDIPANSIDASKIIDGAIAVADVADNAITEAKIADAAVVSLKSGRKNLLINGGFDVWQRGTSFTSTSVNEYSADRFRTEGYGLSTTISRQSFTAGQTDVPNFPTYFCRVATSTVSAGQFWGFQQRIETPQVMSYGQTVTVSFWVKATTGTLASGAFTYGLDSSKSSSPALTTTWQKITNTFTCGLSGNYSSFYLVYLGAGSAAISVDIAQVQLELGSVATDFEHRSYGEELALCQRYYELGGFGEWAKAEISSKFVAQVPFKVPKRTAPSVTLTTTSNVRFREFGIADRDASTCSITSYSATPNGCYIKMNGWSGLTTGIIAAINYTTSTDNGQLFAFDAEL